MMLIYEQIYKKLNNLLPSGIEKFCANPERHIKLKAEGVMDLNIDVITWKAMAHNFIQNGDVMADPDMEIRIHREQKTAEALTFQQDSLGIYQEVYPVSGIINTAVKKSLNTFLLTWLGNLKKQGF